MNKHLLISQSTKFIYLAILYIFLGYFWVNAQIVPVPKHLQQNTGKYAIPTNVSMLVFEHENLFAAQVINESLKKQLQISSFLGRELKKGDIILKIYEDNEVDAKIKELKIPKNKTKEAYHLIISKKNIRIEGFAPQGIFYGAVSLVKLIEDLQKPFLPAQEIIDWPDYDVRGISDDISTKQVSNITSLKQLIHHLAMYKLNTYMLYFEDMLEFDKYMSLENNRMALTQAEVQELVAYAEKHFVNIVPIFETLGHHERILQQSSLDRIAEFPKSSSLCISCDFTYTYLEDMIQNITQLFPSKYIQIGGNVSFDMGAGKSQKALSQQGAAQLYLDHYKKVQAICKKYGKNIIVKETLFQKYPEIRAQFPKDILIVNWQDYKQSLSNTHSVAQADSSSYISTNIWETNTLYPLYEQFHNRIQKCSTQGHSQQINGIITNAKSRPSHEGFKEILYLSHAWVGICTWNSKNPDFSQFTDKFFRDFFGINHPMLAQFYQVLSNPVNHILWNDFWRHPFLIPTKYPVWHPPIPTLAKADSITKYAHLLQQNIDTLKTKVSQNQTHLDILSIMTELSLFYAQKLRIHHKLSQLKTQKELPKNLQPIFIEIEQQIEELIRLKNSFEALWKIYYKEESVSYYTVKFDRLIAYFEETKDDLLERKIPSPLLPSQWIYFCENDSCTSEAIFMKKLILEETPQQAIIQIIAHTEAEVYLNGEFIQEIYTRNSCYLSYSPDIRLINIRARLGKGTNLLEIRTRNYNKGLVQVDSNATAYAGINVILYLEYPSQKEEYIYSDKSWLAKPKREDNKWRYATPKPSPYQIISPNFITERASFIEPL